MTVHPGETFRPLIPVDGEGVVAEVIYAGPVAAPVEQGRTLARLVITVNEQETVSVPLLATTTVPSKGLFARAADAIEELAFGWLRNVQLPWTTAS